jgi:hypothetical protein
VTLGLVVAFWLGGLVGLFGTIVGNWSRKPSSPAEREAFELWCRENPALTFGIVVVLVALWPGLVLWMLGRKDDDELGPPANG